MIKKLLLFTLLFLFLVPRVFAASPSSSVSLSDAVYADLALQHYLDNVSIHYDDGKSENNVTLNDTKHWLPASTVKTFAAMYAYKRIADGTLHLNDNFIIDAKNAVTTELVTPELPMLSAGDSVTLDRLIKQMITQSDNTAFNVMLDILGRDNVTTYIQSLGLTHSKIGSKLNLDTSQEQYEFDTPGYGINTTTAADYAQAFSLIKNNKIPGSNDLFTVLKQQKINNMIPLLLPKDVICAHKTGDLAPLYHDGGICQDKKQSYIVTIFTNAGDPNLLAHLSEIVYTKNYNLVGKITQKKSVGEIENHPIDPLVFTQPSTAVLGASTIPDDTAIPAITAADLGVTAKDLSLVIKDNNLPHVFIPADSPFHSLSDGVQFIKWTLAPTTAAKRDVELEIERLRLAEAQDLLKKGQTQNAQTILQNVQQGLTVIAKNPTTTNSASAQNEIAAISETRFAILGNNLQQASSDQKAVLIKSIATQAKETIQNIQPNIPEAANSLNPSQKPLIGQVVSSTPTELVVRTSGGQQVTVPVTNNISVQNRGQDITNESPTPSEATGETTTPSLSPAPTTQLLGDLAPGTTVALIGSTTNNTFSPSLVLTNIPKELAAPQPVTVAKVDTQNNTMVVVENGVYAQVNITKNTLIQGSNTAIPLNEIKAGDVVVVHGEPLVQTPPPITATPTTSPGPTAKISVTPTSGVNAVFQLQTDVVASISPTKSPSTNATPIPTTVSKILSTTPQAIAPTTSTTNKTAANQTKNSAATISPAGQNKSTTTAPATTTAPVTGKTIAPTQTTSAPAANAPKAATKVQPVIIQSTSVQVVQTQPAAKTPSAPTTAAPAPATQSVSKPAASAPAPAAPAQSAPAAPAPQSNPQPQPQNQPAANAPTDSPKK